MLNWYLQSGKESDVVTSTRVRIARNFANFPFMPKCTKTDGKKIIEKIEEILPNLGYGLRLLRLKDMDDITKMSLIEKHLISPDFALNRNDIGAILINEEENICIMINEEDHLRIQVLAPGLELENALNLAMEIDKKIGQNITYAYNEKYGFLTSCPTNVGTGLRISNMFHLPALTLTGNIEKVLEVVNNFGMNIRGIYGEGSNTQGNLYQVSNKQSLGITEEEILKNQKIIAEKIMEQERLARSYLGKNEIDLADRVYRAYGILTNAQKITSEECKKLLSDIKLGVDMGIIKEIDDTQVNKLYLYTKQANLQKYVGKQLGDYERDIERAKMIKQIVENK